jgi:hypothetical protein
MKKTFLGAVIILSFNSVFAQATKSAFFELGGNGLGFSVNFDSRFTKSEKGFGWRAGIGWIPPTSQADIVIPSTPSILTIPIGVNHLAGKAPNYFESGLGVTYAYVNGNISSDFWEYNEKVKGGTVLFIPSIGYRHAKTGKAFQWRIVVSPIISSPEISFWAGLSLGYKF